MNEKKIKIENCVFIFENTEDLTNFWNESVNNIKSADIVGNKFIVVKDKWLRRFISFMFE